MPREEDLGTEWGTLGRGRHNQTWTAQPVNIAPPKPRRDNGLVNWRKAPAWLLSKVLRWT